MASIGIDLGTTYSCIAVMRKGKVEIIANEHGNRTTPSCVAFTEQERLIGEAAKLQLTKNSKNTVYDAKRLIGRKFREPVVQTDMRNWSFNVFEEDEKPKIGVQYKNKPMEFYPEEISSIILRKLKDMAEEYIGGEVSSAVITVPAHFNDGQRRATADAAEIADLKVLKMINEPTAAALAYGLDKKGSSRRNILIFDLGGGTFDVTVLTMGNGSLDVQATGGDTHLGGQDFNERLYKHCLGEFTRKNKMDMSKDERARHRLLEECEKAKRMLSCSESTEVTIDSLFNKRDFETKITRAQFEDLNNDLFRGTMETVEKVLEDAKMKKDKINDVVLVGGSTRIPYVWELLGKYFGKDKLCKTINPDEAVAYGAAIQAAMLSGDVSGELQSMKLHDVTPLSLGLEKRGTIMNFVIERNTKLPVVKWTRHVTLSDNQRRMTLRVFEGERTETKLNHFLGSFTISDLPPLPAGQAKVNICFDIDANGILNVTGTDLSRPENEVKARITWDKGRWSDEDIKKMVQQAENFREEDKTRKEALIILSKLEILAKKGQRLAKEASRASDSERIKLRDMSNEILGWIDRNPNAEFADSASKKKEIEAVLRPFK